MVSVLSGAIQSMSKIEVPKSDFVKAFEDISRRGSKPKRATGAGPAVRARFGPKPP